MIIRKQTICWTLTALTTLGFVFLLLVSRASGYEETASTVQITQKALIGWIGLAITVIGGWTTLLVGVITWALNRFMGQITGKIDNLQKIQNKEEERRQKAEKDIAKMNGKYVTTDQCGVTKGEINKKLDRVHDRIDELHKFLVDKRDKKI